MTRPLVLGIGRGDAGDDAVGPSVLALLAGQGVAAELRLVRPDPGDLLAAFEGRERAILVDACRSGAAAGTLHRIDLAATRLAADAGHGMGLGAALELVRALGGLPPRCTLHAVEGARFGAGQGLSPPVRSAVTRLAGRIARECLAARDHVAP